MLVDDFYNLTDAKGTPVLNVGTGFGGTIFTWTDSSGDELDIVLGNQAVKNLFAQLLGHPAVRPALDDVLGGFIQRTESAARMKARTKAGARGRK